jgi:hypothetical protein
MEVSTGASNWYQAHFLDDVRYLQLIPVGILIDIRYRQVDTWLDQTFQTLEKLSKYLLPIVDILRDGPKEGINSREIIESFKMLILLLRIDLDLNQYLVGFFVETA